MDAELWVDMAIYLFELDKSEEALKWIRMPWQEH